MKASTGCSCSSLSSRIIAWTLISLAHRQTSPQMIFALCRSQPVGDQVILQLEAPGALLKPSLCLTIKLFLHMMPDVKSSLSLVSLQTPVGLGWLWWDICISHSVYIYLSHCMYTHTYIYIYTVSSPTLSVSHLPLQEILKFFFRKK